jgi:hypothetical protein
MDTTQGPEEEVLESTEIDPTETDDDEDFLDNERGVWH